MGLRLFTQTTSFDMKSVVMQCCLSSTSWLANWPQQASLVVWSFVSNLRVGDPGQSDTIEVDLDFHLRLICITFDSPTWFITVRSVKNVQAGTCDALCYHACSCCCRFSLKRKPYRSFLYRTRHCSKLVAKYYDGCRRACRIRCFPGMTFLYRSSSWLASSAALLPRWFSHCYHTTLCRSNSDELHVFLRTRPR